MSERRVLVVAAENGALPGGAVGEVGDLVRDMAPAVAGRGWAVDVVTPSHGFLHKTKGAYWLGTIPFLFGGVPTSADVYVAPGRPAASGVTHLVIDHPELVRTVNGQPRIYSDDPADAPFASDASKYALFGASVAESVLQELIRRPDCVHLHDWHAAFLLLLKEYDPTYRPLRRVRTAYTIHNLGLQGARPFNGHPSSLASWYPALAPPAEIADPRWPHCLNPMLAGIRLADAVHVPSPSYAEEILRPGDPPRAYGGEGLERPLAEARREGRLFGILHGCDYCDAAMGPKLDFRGLVERMRAGVLGWVAEQGGMSAAQTVALERLRGLDRMRGRPLILTAVSRLIDQKVFLLRACGSDSRSGLQTLLETMEDIGVFFLLGDGDADYERFFLDMSARFAHFVFLDGRSASCASALYASGDLFVMPSSLEPCGAGQMQAMREGQPCLVHGIGGLRDTVADGVNGFVFRGDTVESQVDGLRRACERAALMWIADPEGWSALRTKAAAARFSWDHAAASYIARLYGFPEVIPAARDSGK
jgi:starch synthase